MPISSAPINVMLLGICRAWHPQRAVDGHQPGSKRSSAAKDEARRTVFYAESCYVAETPGAATQSPRDPSGCWKRRLPNSMSWQTGDVDHNYRLFAAGEVKFTRSRRAALASMR